MDGTDGDQSDAAITTRLDPNVLANLRAIGDAAFCAELVDDYETSTTATLGTLERALTAGDFDAVERAAHSLKSASASIGAAAFAEHCRDVETSGRDGDIDTARKLADDLPGHRDAVVVALRREFPA